MITEDILKKLAQKRQTTELNIKREYMQHLFLSYFYRTAGSSKIFFKGGTALKILYNSPRFSEDLDFSAAYSKISTIEKTLVQTLYEIEKEGISSDINEAKTTSGGYLARIMFQSYGNSMGILLQISLRQGGRTSELVTVAGDFIPPYTIMALDREQLVSEKIQALINRQKPRDFYDLYFIIRANLLPARDKAVLHRVINVLKSTELNFENELKQFLPRSHWPQLRDFKTTLKREIQRFL